jgi:DNA replication and repair protein RecF
LHINNIKIQNLRLFRELLFNPSNHINLITGPNGAGKTSLLESIYLLARNRSFRTNNITSLINRSAEEFIITALLTKDSGESLKIGLKKSSTTTDLHIAGQKQKRVTDQARKIPLTIVTANSQKLITEGPDNRRKFLNWGVFHVEHIYSDTMAKYNKVLFQRNSALRRQDSSYRIWDRQFIKYSNQLDQFRSNYLRNFKQQFQLFVDEYQEFKEIDIRYKRGWNQNIELEKELINRDDKILRYTYFGPHRADIGIYINNLRASEILSNGQLKLLTILLILTQLIIVKKITQETPVLLIDDLQSEIDSSNLKRILKTIKSIRSQTFITSTDLELYFQSGFEGGLFHVEHGEIY